VGELLESVLGDSGWWNNEM